VKPEARTTIIQTKAYRDAFGQYLRNGTPIRLSLKAARETERYVWRTRGDIKVRPAHRRNDGRIFSWSDPPSTGHPGVGYNCRCEAVPYVPGATEFAYHEFTSKLASPNRRWITPDFMRHYYYGDGRPVTLLEIGHLRAIAEYYAYDTGAEGAFRRLSDQIAGAAREEGAGPFTYPFRGAYDFDDVSFSHGGSKVEGMFSGVAEDRGATYRIAGESTFWFTDVFIDPLGSIDPLDLNLEPGGIPYPVSGSWSASFTAEIFKEKSRSGFFYEN
jgi:SPP1 gp7 family putative phage head morphogenesis protein